MILNCLKCDLAVISIESIASVVPLIFSPKTLISNKMLLPPTNSRKVLELVESELEKTFSIVI